MSMEELLTLPVSFGIKTAARALGLSDHKAYEMAAAGEFPCQVLRLGQQYRVTRADLFRTLGLDPAMVARTVEPGDNTPVLVHCQRDGLSGDAVRALYEALVAAARVLVDRNVTS